MAKATANTTKTTVMKPVVEEVVTGVTLTLDKDEAQFLADVLAKVGGSPEYSRRRHQQPISDALASAGIKHQYPLPDVNRNSGISFEDDRPGNQNKW